MKWYNADNFEPPGNCDLFTFCRFYCWDRLAVSRYVYENGVGKFYEFKQDVDGKEISKSEIDVTHFCIPDPIEIEE